MDGFLLVDKPKGISSFGVVYKVRKILTHTIRQEHEARGFCTERQFGGSASSELKRTDSTLSRAAQQTDSKMSSEPINEPSLNSVDGWRCKCRVKVGHGGTLDPMATGLLVLAVGKATKQINDYIGADKNYIAELTLGSNSTTEDAEGELTKVSDYQPSKDEAEKAINSFKGKIMQLPPVFSALKVNGKRAYDLARTGKEVKLEPRPVIIYKIDLLSYEYPKIALSCGVSKGTYIRSLGRDIGAALNTGAYLSELKRTKIGNLELSQAQDLNKLSSDNILSYLINP